MALLTLEGSTAAIASAIAEPARARILFGLLDGRARTSTELSLVAEVSASTASAHLARLLRDRLVAVRSQGRHRYYCIADYEVAEALERLSVLASRVDCLGGDALRRTTPTSLQHARTCYDHLAGILGVALHDVLIARAWIATTKTAGEYSVTQLGRVGLAECGVGGEALKPARRRFAFDCLDWSERRPHLAGALAAALLTAMLDRRWLLRERDSRAVRLTTLGKRELLGRFQLRLDD